jgi:hypothetical protein
VERTTMNRQQQQQSSFDRVAREQQMSGSNDFQNQQQPGAKPSAASGKQQQMGEGSYEGTRDYNQRTADYLKTHDVKKDAEAAQPKSEQEAREMKAAEEEARSHSKAKGE